MPNKFAKTSDLPPADSYWTARRKAAIVDAVRAGRVSCKEVCRRYRLSVEEFEAWERDLRLHGLPGLRTTRYQIYRDTTSSAPKSPLPRHLQPAHTARHGVSRDRM
jgi:hypothetical protein